MLTRKKSLKIQERLGMRIGVAYGISSRPIAKSTSEALEAITELYKIGFKAFLLPKELFYRIIEYTTIYKEHYNELLKIRNLAEKYNIELSVRFEDLPEDPFKLDSILKVFMSVASVMGCRNFIFQPNFFKMMPRDQSITLVVHKINEIMNSLNLKVTVGVETTGKLNEVGSVEDVIEIAKRIPNAEPVINFAHVHARGAGALRTDSDFKHIIEKVRKDFPKFTQNSYLLFSGVKYGPSGEIKHIPFRQSDLDLNHLIKALMTYGAKGTLIFEEPEREKSILDTLNNLADMVR